MSPPDNILIGRALPEKVNAFVAKDFVEIGFEGGFALEYPVADIADNCQDAVGIRIKCLVFRHSMFSNAFPNKIRIAAE
jgi:hypothetical protein